MDYPVTNAVTPGNPVTGVAAVTRVDLGTFGTEERAQNDAGDGALIKADIGAVIDKVTALNTRINDVHNLFQRTGVDATYQHEKSEFALRPTEERVYNVPIISALFDIDKSLATAARPTQQKRAHTQAVLATATNPYLNPPDREPAAPAEPAATGRSGKSNTYPYTPALI